MEITSPIVFTAACAKELMHKKGKIPVSGVKRIVKGESEMIINYGDGECDFVAEVTKDGVTETIDLKEIKRKRKFRKLKSKSVCFNILYINSCNFRKSFFI